ncbi:peroxidase family protein [Micromonospora sp. NBC_00858]|uniref:peroxidase family protein n=1 Tax=Micromonospora sp. NBC_00858 TaxID=2975979 RepID=UPI003869BC79|nr:heme peroxidase family protein [Micromonospora sp. NBC_00858]
MRRHERDEFLVEREGIITFDASGQPVTRQVDPEGGDRRFRFSRLGPKSPRQPENELVVALATAMTSSTTPDSRNPVVPAGFTYLGQFVDHDLTMDATATSLGEEVTDEELLQGRSPALDLDSLYGRGPRDDEHARFYQPDGARLRVGTSAGVDGDDTVASLDLEGFDLPRRGVGATKATRRMAEIPDTRNDQNLIVAQVHLAFIRFHNRVVDYLVEQGVPADRLFDEARDCVERHYQWMLRTDFLPRIVSPTIVEDVFANRRRFVDPGNNSPTPTMPIEFSVAAYRLGHSMIRETYEWNRFFHSGPDALAPGSLPLLFNFSGTSGTLSPDGSPDDPESGSFERLPTNWIADFRRLFDFSEAGREDLAGPGLNLAKRIDTLLVDPLGTLPEGSFGGGGSTPPVQRNLAFRNLTRAGMVDLATGQQMADLFGCDRLTAGQLLDTDGGADLSELTTEQRDLMAHETPLWFYVLREAEVSGGRLGPVGGRIVVEVFHRAIAGSRVSTVRDPDWRPFLGDCKDRFTMVDLLLFTFDGKADLINPLGD